MSRRRPTDLATRSSMRNVAEPTPHSHIFSPMSTNFDRSSSDVVTRQAKRRERVHVLYRKNARLVRIARESSRRFEGRSTPTRARRCARDARHTATRTDVRDGAHDEEDDGWRARCVGARDGRGRVHEVLRDGDDERAHRDDGVGWQLVREWKRTYRAMTRAVVRATRDG